ncbi:MAG: DUF2779 domain-containing protein [Candidatus Omnitrophica bacterium]|nr:DUF2779 domain-containing protein [Candidatus Omnitrophota bacterium]MBU1047046.1 DUF2779 domain-containing protein [Candidatus Omnitrophota bacterium]MBU1630455.1 DUF2779 domain-containing protein [Candidatus Omnitrophota bacterium]MBU1767325.1 DUF2779 domain-containing protein [Candidatus Omnitrophota bacterium]MBU1889284.1 DUF2779 domain-containing protein [Candidatus Omnitrophota bacterium]
MRNKLLTKSNYVIGLQCPKYLWTKLYEKEKIPPYDASTLHRFEEGHLVDKFSRDFFPAGTDIPTEDFMGNIKQTKELLAQRKLIFQAGILHDPIYSRIDILNPTHHNVWDIIEVKSSTKVKPEHLEDVSFQKYCCEKSGLKIGRCFLMHVNNEYIKQGEINPKDFFNLEDITAEVNAAMLGIEQRIDNMLKTIGSEQSPDISIGKHCNNPYECPLKGSCWNFLPPGHIFELYYGGSKSLQLFGKGIHSIKDIPANVPLTERQMIQKECESTGKPYISEINIKTFVDGLDYPLHYLDFETFDPCIPIFDGTRPYQKIPFQFSLHIVADENSKPRHYYFLADGVSDPRPKFLSSLKDVLGNSGSIIVYNQVFEKTILKELGEAFPDYKEWVGDVSDRIKDLLDVFKSFDYYHPNQRGSASIKSVLPALTQISYEGMNISDGEYASLSFLEMAYSNITKEQKDKIREDLSQYCSLDTEGMLLIVKKLKELTEK